MIPRSHRQDRTSQREHPETVGWERDRRIRPSGRAAFSHLPNTTIRKGTHPHLVVEEANIPSTTAAAHRQFLVVGDPADTGLLEFVITKAHPEGGVDVHRAATTAETLATLGRNHVDCVLLALDASGVDPLDLVDALTNTHPGVAIVVVAGAHEGECAEEALRHGAHESVWRGELASPALRRAMTRAREQAHVRYVERRMARIMERANDVVCVIGEDGRAGYVSPSFENVTGFSMAPTKGERRELNLTHPDDVPRISTAVGRARAGMQDHATLEYRGRHSDGTWRWREMTVTNLLDDPFVKGIVLTIRDVNDRRRAEEAIRFRSHLLESLGQSVIATAPDLTVQFWNEAATELYGWTAEEAIGRPIAEVTCNPQQWQAIAARFKTHTGGDVWSGDFELCRKDGTIFQGHVTNTLLRDEEGEVVANIGVTTDLTERLRQEEMHARLSAIVESSVDAVVSVDLAGTVVSWNGAATALHGRRPDEVVGKSLDELADRYGIDLGLSDGLEALRDGDPLNPLRAVTRPAHAPHRHTSHYYSPIRDLSGHVVSVSVVSRDITDQVELVDRLERDRHRLNEAQRTAHLGSFELNRLTGVLTWSDQMYDIVGVPRDVVVTDDTYRQRIHPDDREWAETELIKVLEPGVHTEVVHRIVRLSDSEVRWVTARAGPGRELNMIHGTVYDMTELKLAELELAHQAYHDRLTRLPNRSWLEERLARLTDDARRTDAHLTVALLDLDQFKVINDSLGHTAGDRMLESVAGRLLHACRPDDVVARFGGDEFVVARVGFGVEAHDAAELGAELQTALRAPIQVAGRDFPISSSIGITTSKPGDTPGTLLRDADSAMYAAKRRGKDQFVLFDDRIRARTKRRLDLEGELHHAIARDELAAHYQPVVDLATGLTVGFEALLRWHHPTLGRIAPEEFVPIAEDSGLILPIGDWVLQEAAAQLARWRASGEVTLDTWMAVNVSNRQLATNDLVRSVQRILDDVGLPPANLHLEITESVLMDDVEHSLDMTRALHDLGVPISIDDFGTGYSSLSYLKRLPVATLKIDRSFVAGLGRDAHDTSIVSTIVALAHGLGMTVVAEGIEDDVQHETLLRLGCEFGQGFLWSPPVPADAARSWAMACPVH